MVWYLKYRFILGYPLKKTTIVFEKFSCLNNSKEQHLSVLVDFCDKPNYKECVSSYKIYYVREDVIANVQNDKILK